MTLAIKLGETKQSLKVPSRTTRIRTKHSRRCGRFSPNSLPISIDFLERLGTAWIINKSLTGLRSGKLSALVEQINLNLPGCTTHCESCSWNSKIFKKSKQYGSHTKDINAWSKLRPTFSWKLILPIKHLM